MIKKIRALKASFPRQKIIAAMWFSDESLKKNRKFYAEQIANNTDSMVEISIFYGREIFERLFRRLDIWEELIAHLKRNKAERSGEILSVPDFDKSEEIRAALLKIKQNEPKLIKNLLSNRSEFVELKSELFPTSKNLRGL